MATAAQQDFWISREVKNEEGIIDSFSNRGFGYIAVDSGNKTERYWFHCNVFPADQKAKINIGRRVIFSAEGGQKLTIAAVESEQKWPRVYEARLVRN